MRAGLTHDSTRRGTPSRCSCRGCVDVRQSTIKTDPISGDPTDAEYLFPSAFYGKVSKNRRGKPDTRGWGVARHLAGRKDLRFHDLRRGALTEAA